MCVLYKGVIIVKWDNVRTIESRKYVCGHCDAFIASNQGYYAKYQSKPPAAPPAAFIYICHQCKYPTFFDPNDNPSPGSTYGEEVQDVEELVSCVYREARYAYSAGSYTASVLCCRKLLMHIAVSKGASVGESFISYVEYLADNNYVPPDARDWVDHIRKKGNEANHEIIVMQKEDAEELISFCEMLLKIVFEFPAAARRKTQASPNG